MTRKRIKVTEESDSGRNKQFHDNRTGENMTRKQLVDKINDGDYPGYHIRRINGINTPVSNPDRSENNNLG